MKAIELFFISSLTCFSMDIYAQAPIRKLPQSINRPSVNVTAPFISLDGNTLVFTSDYAEDNELTIYYTQKVQANFKEPQVLPKHINNKLNFAGGYTLSADGNTIYITTLKSGGVGGFDIWAGNLKGASWGDLQNMFIPINSALHDGCPTFTPDGKTMYFMRCTTMNQKKAENCKIMVANKGANGRWQEPAELPPNINTGNSQTPRISSGGEILIFASDAIKPNKGGLDLYASKFNKGSWSDPEALDFVNTTKDDQFVSFIANGRYILKDAPGAYTSEILEYLVPEEWRPPAQMKIEGFINNANGAPTPAYISVIDLTTQERIFNGRPDKEGGYYLYLKEGNKYELAVDPEQSNFTYFSKVIDMTGTGSPLTLKINPILNPVEVGDELKLEGIQFKSYTSELDRADSEIRRLSRLIKAAPQFEFEVQVLLAGYEEDSLRTNPDLTEISIDTVLVQFDEVDSLGLTIARDSMMIERTYHNNRTENQAISILDALAASGVDPEALSYSVNALPEPIAENRRIQVRVVVHKKE